MTTCQSAARISTVGAISLALCMTTVGEYLAAGKD